MVYLGIDYGSKYIGLSTSDESGVLAFPHTVLDNKKDILKKISEVIKEKNIESIVIGDSVDQKGEKNDIARDAEKFGNLIKERLGIEVVYEKEQFTSAHARHSGSQQKGRIDASAAALILQRYLDKQNNK